MAEELPFFKFVISQYLAGDIYNESRAHQGVFYDLCAYYWAKDCEVSLEALQKRYRSEDDRALLNDLFKSGILKIEDDTHLSISFLNEQWNSKQAQRAVNSVNGKKGGRPKKLSASENGSDTENTSLFQNKPKEKGKITESVFSDENPPEKKPNGFNFDNRNDNRNKSHIEVDIELEREEEREEELPPFPSVIPLGDKFLKLEKVELTKDICTWFNMGAEKLYFREQADVLVFLNIIHNEGLFEHFKTQWENYKAYKDLAGNPHSLFGFIGKKVPGKSEFEGAKWNSANWASMLENQKSSSKLGEQKKQSFEEKMEQSQNSINPFDPNAPAPL